MNEKDKFRGRALVLWILIPAAIVLAGVLLMLQCWSGKEEKPGPQIVHNSPRRLDAQILSLSGKVEVERSGLSGRFRLGPLSPLLAGDRILTPAQARVKLSMKESRLLLGPNSCLELVGDRNLWLQTGQLAGQATGAQLQLRVADGRVDLRKGRFLLERTGAESWSLLLTEGQTEIRADPKQKSIKLRAGQRAKVQREKGVWFLRVEAADGEDHPLLRRMGPLVLHPKKPVKKS